VNNFLGAISMCGGVLYEHDGREERIGFPRPGARLPVTRRHGEPVLLLWGRRRDEAGTLPFGGWARLESIRAGRWDHWQPQPVRLAIRAFMERDIEGESHWFTLNSGQWVQGLVARNGAEQRVYVVTITPQMPEAVHERWPRIITA
jgi:hypothetical protein